MSLPVTLILIGDAPGQTDLRFDLVDLDGFSYGGRASTEAWIAHLVGIEQQLRLLRARDGMLSEGDMPEYLFRLSSQALSNPNSETASARSPPSTSGPRSPPASTTSPLARSRQPSPLKSRKPGKSGRTPSGT